MMFTMSRIHSFHDNSKMFFATSIEDIIDVTFLPEHALSAGLSGKRASCMTGFNRKAAKQNLPELSSSPILESTQEHNQQNQHFFYIQLTACALLHGGRWLLLFSLHTKSILANHPSKPCSHFCTRWTRLLGSWFKVQGLGKKKKAHSIEMLATQQKSRII